MKKSIVLLGIILILSGCSNKTDSIQTIQLTNTTTPQSIVFNKDVEEEDLSFDRIPDSELIKEVTISAVGDIMVHQWQITRAYNEKTDEFDFSDAFKHIAPYLQRADLTVGNLETTFGGKDNGIRMANSFYFRGYTGYPCFNTPEILAYNLKDAGFDLLSTANNHSLDSRAIGVINTLDFLDDAGLEYVGTHRNQEEKETIKIKEINDITFGFGAYTYGTNGLVVPADRPYLVNTLDMYNPVKIAQMIEDIKVMSPLVDFVVVFIHFGNEYFDHPNDHQRRIVDQLFEAGADVILGSHPHVLQPIEIRQIKDGEEERTGVVIYSLGNFISSQRYSTNRPKDTDIGMIFDIHFEKIYNDKPTISGISIIPTMTHWNSEAVSVIPVNEVYENLDATDIKLSNFERERLKYSYTNSFKHLISYLNDITYHYEDYIYTININE
ncbi:poly-gamma-glutamate synthesis protein (capsule biosynthesis protein) [Natranaerovirga pectinivora]|uniref:Poly-gamma-glutamate synthesis protein (Capsule biosynthesis protein) n=1 Tax=Natranaerovirga pectinivora TaxID=682400 RepID=A0A4R3MPA1_9FIRM|nr:CapA family protein [Natranaerovirga pectinivora]TCT17051.1 poly-gamma-glutamate synthesis protein (capsule biosynthesis protein) [Natranaerovirga pectinivora]